MLPLFLHHHTSERCQSVWVSVLLRGSVPLLVSLLHEWWTSFPSFLPHFLLLFLFNFLYFVCIRCVSYNTKLYQSSTQHCSSSPYHSLPNTFSSPSQGDVTTTMLWINGQISALPTITGLFLPSLVSVLLSIGSLLIFDSYEGCDERFIIKHFYHIYMRHIWWILDLEVESILESSDVLLHQLFTSFIYSLLVSMVSGYPEGVYLPLNILTLPLLILPHSEHYCSFLLYFIFFSFPQMKHKTET